MPIWRAAARQAVHRVLVRSGVPIAEVSTSPLGVTDELPDLTAPGAELTSLEGSGFDGRTRSASRSHEESSTFEGTDDKSRSLRIDASVGHS